MRSLASMICASIVTILAASALANHEPTPTTDENSEAAILLSSTSTTTTAVVGGIILTVMMASDAESMEQYLEDNAVALQSDVTLGAGETIDDLALAFGIEDADRAAFGRIVRDHRRELLVLAAPERLTPARAAKFVEVILLSSANAGIVPPLNIEQG